MRKRTLVALTLALGTLGGIASLAQQRPNKTEPAPPAIPDAGKAEPAPIPDPPANPAETLPPKAIPANANPASPSSPATEPPPLAQSPAEIDPMQTVESFVARSRKEADDAIKNLTTEAEALRTRLKKVEAALERWQGVSRALGENPGGVGELQPAPIEKRPEALEVTPPAREP
jgi:hypothetical protein